MKRAVAFALAFATLGLTACGAPSSSVSDNPYDDYLRISEEVGGMGAEISKDDAAVQATLNCQPNAKDDLYGGVPLSEFPTDLALVRAYCPDKEW
jgi:hypothetical protein